jgi:hypothetical protein
MKCIKSYRILITFLLFIFISKALYSQGGPVPPTPGGGIPGQEGIPVDGGITILVAAGIGFGVKKIKDARKNNQEACKHSGE